MFVALRLRSEGGALSASTTSGSAGRLARHRLDSAVVAGVAEMEVIEDGVVAGALFTSRMIMSRRIVDRIGT